MGRLRASARNVNLLLAMVNLGSGTARVYRYCTHGLTLQRGITGAGAFVAGLISTGVGEATLPALVRRSRFPVTGAASPTWSS